MIPGFRTIIGLMLAAGICVGVFATNLLAGDPPGVRARLDPSIEAQMERYRNDYNLSPADQDAVRRELVRFRDAVRQKRIELQGRHQDEYDAIIGKTSEAIRSIVTRTEAGASRGR